jgi:hypothetical protein
MKQTIIEEVYQINGISRFMEVVYNEFRLKAIYPLSMIPQRTRSPYILPLSPGSGFISLKERRGGE